MDDDLVILRGLADALGRAGCDAKTAASGHEAMEAYARHPYDLVLLDVRLPDMGGLEVLSRILGQDDDQLVIMMTAYADASVAVQAMKSGAHDYIHKPLDLEELKILITKAMETRRMKGEIEALR
ncbi:MAG: response regulator, partial [Thermodesulfobacteriota bacterium]